ncbi:MAG: energy-coupling factor transporter transmembrane protein EcfT [Anaerolineae bacterium]|nr:energy-coupling factor transporter transmembrane protein EcfT [Anaerolineae bacterium]
MEDFRLIQYLTTGQVLPTGSPIHRLDPRARLLGFVGILVVFVTGHSVSTVTAALLVTAGLLLLARVPAGYAVRGIGALVPWLLVVAVLQLVFSIGDGPACAEVLRLGPLRVTWCTLEFAGVTLIRVLGLVLLMGLLTWTSSITGLVHGIETLARPLDRVGVPAHGLAMVGAIALRFVPTMAMEADRLLKAQAARGGDLQQGRLGVIHRIRRILPLLVPLFALALRRAERLAEAMDSRAYAGGRGRGQYARLQMKRIDWLSLCLVALFVVGSLAWG